MRQIKVNSTIGSELISTADVKSYARIDTDADDTLISNMIVQARIWIENFISKDIVSKNRTYYLPETSGVFDLPFAPISSVSSVTSEGEAADYSEYGLDDTSIELDGGYSKHVKVTYITAGLSDELLKQAMLQLVATYYDNRADFIVGESITEIPSNVKNILTGYKTMFI